MPLSASYCRLWTEFNSSSICVFLYRQTFLSTDRTKIVKCFWCLTICSYDRRYFEAKWGWFCQNFEWVLEVLFCNVAKTILIVDFSYFDLAWIQFTSIWSNIIIEQNYRKFNHNCIPFWNTFTSIISRWLCKIINF